LIVETSANAAKVICSHRFSILIIIITQKALMEQTDFKAELVEKYNDRDVDGIIQLVTDLVKSMQFPALNRRLVKEGKLSAASTKIEDVADALIKEIEEELNQSKDVIVQDNYFDIAAQLEKRFSKDVSEIYLRTKTPDEFLHEIRTGQEQADAGKVSESLVNQYKNELIRIEDGRRVVVDILQQHSNFPLKNVKALSELIELLHTKIKSNYRYLSIKPFFINIFEAGEAPLNESAPVAVKEAEADSDSESTSNKEVSSYSLFPNYTITGQEPSLIQQFKFRISVIKLFQFLWKRKILPVAEHKKLLAVISSHFNYRGDPDLSKKARHFLEDLVTEISADQEAILRRLARTFVDEYRSAERQMEVRHGMIETELAQTKEYLKQLTTIGKDLSEEEEDKVRVALEKITNLEGVFKISPVREESAANTSFTELERTALGVSTVISPTQITEWIRIYSILFSNAEFLAYSNEIIDFSVMRDYISDLTTYHLIQSVSELKLVVDRTITAPSDDKPDYFKRFGEVLKIKLQGLIGTQKEGDMTFQQMIEELGFLQNDATQFVIADTFKGFQAIADAFNNTVNDYFVRDRETLLKESRGLYSQICAQCLKNVIVRPKKPRPLSKGGAAGGGGKGKSWLGRLFS